MQRFVRVRPRNESPDVDRSRRCAGLELDRSLAVIVQRRRDALDALGELTRRTRQRRRDRKNHPLVRDAGSAVLDLDLQRLGLAGRHVEVGVAVRNVDVPAAVIVRHAHDLDIAKQLLDRRSVERSGLHAVRRIRSGERRDGRARCFDVRAEFACDLDLHRALDHPGDDRVVDHVENDFASRRNRDPTDVLDLCLRHRLRVDDDAAALDGPVEGLRITAVDHHPACR